MPTACQRTQGQPLAHDVILQPHVPLITKGCAPPVIHSLFAVFASFVLERPFLDVCRPNRLKRFPERP